MKKIKRVLLGTALVISAGATLAACGNTPAPTTTPAPTSVPTTTTSEVNYQRIVNSILLTQDGKAVSEDFELIKQAGGQNVTWTSNDESVVKVVEKDGKLLAGVIIPTAAKTVKLTATVGTASKEFTVKVNPVTALQIGEKFNFSSNGAIVYHTEEGIELAEKTSIKHKSAALAADQVFEASIAWSIKANTTLLSISEDGKKLMVTDADEKTPLSITATFTYGEDTAEIDYPISVWHKLEGNEQTRYWIDSVGGGEKFDVTGYLISTAGYADNYGEGNFYIMDADLKGAYYIYNAYMDKTLFDSLVGGEVIQFTGLKSQSYHGLIESNYGAKTKVLTAEEATAAGMTKTTAEISQAMLTFDNLLASDAKELVYYQNMPVKLTGWELSSDYVAPKTDSTASTSQTLFTVKKGGSEVAVVVNKNLIDITDDEFAALLEGLKTLKKGNFVDLQGLYSYYDGHQILLGIVAPATSAKKATDGEAFASAVEKVQEGIKLSYVKDGEYVLPAQNGVTITYELSTAEKVVGYTYKTIKIENGKLVIAVEGHDLAGNELQIGYTENVDLVAKVAKKVNNVDLTKTIKFNFNVSYLAVADQVSAEIDNLTEKLGEDVPYVNEFTLPATGELFDTELTYELVGEPTIASIADGKLTINPTTTATEVTLKITGKLMDGETEVTKVVNHTFNALYAPSKLEDILAEKSADKEYVVEGIIVSLNRPSSSGYSSFVIVDAQKDIMFSYDGLKATDVAVGDKVIIVAKYSENNATPQLSKLASGSIKLVKVLSHDNDLEAALPTPTDLDGATDIPTIANLKSNEEVVAKYAGNFYKVKGYIAMDGTYTIMLGAADAQKSAGYYSLYANDSFNLAAYAGKQVYLYAAFRGNNLNNKYVTLQVVDIDFVGDEPTNETVYLSAKSVEIQLESGKVVTKKVTVAKTPWTTGDVTFEVASADETKATVAYDATKGEITITGVAATDSVKVTVTPSTGDAVQIDVKVNEAAADSQLAASLSFASDAKRVSQDNNSQVWRDNNITFTNAKASSTTNVVGNTNPIRCYKDSTITIEYTGMVKIVVKCNSNSYATELAKSTFTGATLVADGKNVTITLSSAINTITLSLAAQVRIDSIDVYTAA